MRMPRAPDAPYSVAWWTIGLLATLAVRADASSCGDMAILVLWAPTITGDVVAVTGAQLALDELLLDGAYYDDGWVMLASRDQVPDGESPWWAGGEVADDAWLLEPAGCSRCRQVAFGRVDAVLAPGAVGGSTDTASVEHAFDVRLLVTDATVTLIFESEEGTVTAEYARPPEHSSYPEGFL